MCVMGLCSVPQPGMGGVAWDCNIGVLEREGGEKGGRDEGGRERREGKEGGKGGREGRKGNERGREGGEERKEGGEGGKEEREGGRDGKEVSLLNILKNDNENLLVIKFSIAN